ncbi:MAG: hypothetical protein IPK78_00685 [Rhodospirillales bacterium]|nr:hypothetical protein [Rhodospirillales bacterium]
MSKGKEPFENAPDLKRAFQDANDNRQPAAATSQEQGDGKSTDAPEMHLKPEGEIRNAVDRKVAAEKAAEFAQNKADTTRKPRRVLQLTKKTGLDKGNEPKI